MRYTNNVEIFTAEQDTNGNGIIDDYELTEEQNAEKAINAVEVIAFVSFGLSPIIVCYLFGIVPFDSAISSISVAESVIFCDLSIPPMMRDSSSIRWSRLS